MEEAFWYDAAELVEEPALHEGGRARREGRLRPAARPGEGDPEPPAGAQGLRPRGGAMTAGRRTEHPLSQAGKFGPPISWKISI